MTDYFTSSGSLEITAKYTSRAVARASSASVREGSSVSPGYRNFHAYSVSGTAWSMIGLSAESSARHCSPSSSKAVRFAKRAVVPGQEALQGLLSGLLAVKHDVVQQRWDRVKLMLRRPEVARGPDNPSPGFGHAGRIVGRGHAACTSRPSEAIVAGSEARTCARLSKKLRVNTTTSAARPVPRST